MKFEITPYRVPFYPNMVGAHLFVGWPAGSVLESLLDVSPEAPELYFPWSPESGRGVHYTTNPDGLVSSVVGLGRQPICCHADSCQAFFFQEVDLVQGSYLREFEWSRPTNGGRLGLMWTSTPAIHQHLHIIKFLVRLLRLMSTN
jgi:hypothetical protein